MPRIIKMLAELFYNHEKQQSKEEEIKAFLDENELIARRWYRQDPNRESDLHEEDNPCSDSKTELKKQDMDMNLINTHQTIER